MLRSKILGIGSYVPDNVVTNDDLRFLNDRHERQAEVVTDTNDQWIQERSGIKERRFVSPTSGMATSDLALAACQAALTDANVAASDIDCIIFGTLSPDIHFPGAGVFLQQKLGIAGPDKQNCPCYDIRQQCSAFLYGMQMADAFIRAGVYKKILLVGAELHSHALDYSTRGRDVLVLFGDGAGAMVIGAEEHAKPGEGITYVKVHADGTGAMSLYLKIFDIKKLPYVDYDASNRDANIDLYPRMDGKRVFLNAVRNMNLSTQAALKDAGLTWDDITWFVPHQANLRINQKVVEIAGIPPEKALNTIEWYGNTTAATVPLTIDYWRKQGNVKKGDRILSTVFGSGYTWGSAIFTV